MCGGVVAGRCALVSRFPDSYALGAVLASRKNLPEVSDPPALAGRQIAEAPVESATSREVDLNRKTNDNTHAASPLVPAVPAVPAVMVVLVLGLFTGLVLAGMDLQTAAVTVGVGGLLGIELVRRLMQVLPSRRSR